MMKKRREVAATQFLEECVIIMKKMRLTVYVLTLCLGILCVACGQTTGGKQRFERTYYDYFDTVTTIVGYEADQAAFDANCERIAQELAYYHKLYDIYHAYPDVVNLYTVNESAGVAPVAVDPELLVLLETALDGYTVTKGATNVAMGSVLAIWHAYREAANAEPAEAQLPPMDQLEAAAAHCDPADVILDTDRGMVYLADPALRLDVGAVAKGFALQQIAEGLRETQVEGYMLNVGGSILPLGSKPDGSDWIVGVQNPDITSEQSYLCTVGLQDMALVTSGAYQRYYEVDGVRYHHIIDPNTLMPSQNFISVTILGPDAALADALSTACFTLSLEDGLDLIEGTANTEAMWVEADGTEHFSSGFSAYILEE